MGGRGREPDRSPKGGGVPLLSRWPMLPEALVAGLVLPLGYDAGSEALLIPSGEILTATPVLPVAEIQDLDQAARFYELVIVERETYRRHVVPARVLRDRRQVLELVGLGVDVSSGSDVRLIQFFREYLRCNRLPRRQQTRRLGWRPTDAGGVYLLDRAYPQGDPLHFDADTEEAQRFQAALRPVGTLAAWAAAFAKITGYPIPLVACLAALVPPLRQVLRLEVPSFWLHLVAPTSTGKSVAQRLALSIWADPFAEAWLPSGHGTYAGIEALCLRVFGLPVFLQDVQLIRDQDRQTLIYAVGNEAFKARGGERRRTQVPWRGVVLSSGELALVHGGSLGGEGARVLTCAGPPFGAQDPATRALLDEDVLETVREHHGLVGRAVVEHCGGLDLEQRAARRREWEDLRQQFAARAEGHPVLNRQAGQWAALALAGRLLATILGTDAEPLVKAVQAVFDRARGDEAPSVARRAYDLLVSAVESQPRACHHWDGTEYTEPTGFGRHVGVVNAVKGFVALFPDVAEEILRRHGLEPPGLVFQAMRDAGLLEVEGGRLRARVAVRGRQVRLLRLPYPAPGDTVEQGV